eukprot:TRINITY_DN5557_c0_g4_i1.p1 TRINITY_DN5557_c0_g4~~TRINITY_DN5557_c0_g4_i1.p1  ORF type:complete len:333 (+),score=26.42 TRINITY_DN5557_c0_g4_i1:345-1343(+)
MAESESTIEDICNHFFTEVLPEFDSVLPEAQLLWLAYIFKTLDAIYSDSLKGVRLDTPDSIEKQMCDKFLQKFAERIWTDVIKRCEKIAERAKQLASNPPQWDQSVEYATYLASMYFWKYIAHNAEQRELALDVLRRTTYYTAISKKPDERVSGYRTYRDVFNTADMSILPQQVIFDIAASTQSPEVIAVNHQAVTEEIKETEFILERSHIFELDEYLEKTLLIPMKELAASVSQRPVLIATENAADVAQFSINAIMARFIHDRIVADIWEVKQDAKTWAAFFAEGGIQVFEQVFDLCRFVENREWREMKHAFADYQTTLEHLHNSILESRH